MTNPKVSILGANHQWVRLYQSSLYRGEPRYSRQVNEFQF
jgi:hypothetical protein